MDKMEMLDCYLDGSLTASETKSFEALMAKDEELRLEYKLHQDMSKALLNDKADDFRLMLDKAHLHYEKKDRKPMFYKMAAAILILLSIGGSLLMLTHKVEPTKALANKFYKTYQPLNGVRSEHPSQDKV